HPDAVKAASRCGLTGGCPLLYKHQHSTQESSSSSALKASRVVVEEEEPSFDKLKAKYPLKRFDEGPSKERFKSFTREERVRVFQRLEVYLTCDRWLDQNGQFIPFCSTWLKSYDADPPPVLKKSSVVAAEQHASESERRRKIIDEALRKEKEEQ